MQSFNKLNYMFVKQVLEKYEKNCYIRRKLNIKDDYFWLYGRNYHNTQSKPYIPDHSNRIFIVRGSGSGKTNALLNVIYHQQRDLFILIQYYYK